MEKEKEPQVDSKTWKEFRQILSARKMPIIQVSLKQITIPLGKVSAIQQNQELGQIRD